MEVLWRMLVLFMSIQRVECAFSFNRIDTLLLLATVPPTAIGDRLL